MTKEDMQKMVIAEARNGRDMAVFCGNKIVIVGTLAGWSEEELLTDDNFIGDNERVPEFGGAEEWQLRELLDVRLLWRVSEESMEYFWQPYAQSLKTILAIDRNFDLLDTPEYKTAVYWESSHLVDVALEVAEHLSNGRKINYFTDDDYIIIESSEYCIADYLRSILAEEVDWAEMATMDDTSNGAPYMGKFIIADAQKRSALIALIDAYNAAINPDEVEFMRAVRGL